MINMIRNIVLFCLLLFGFGLSAQTVIHNTKIKDESVIGSAATPSPISILELESTKKGLLLPRMTTDERRALKPGQYKNSSGLVIFNKDTDCIEYWNAQKDRWVSLCGALPPADIIIDRAKCDDIHIVTADGKPLQSGKYLRPNDLLIIDVNVASVGTYDIYATSNNGYYFSATGTFLRTGSIKVALQGVGTPINGYESNFNGDNLDFFINGKKIEDTCAFSSFVQKANIEFNIVCTSPYKASGKYYIGTNFSQLENYVDIEVEVIQEGAYRITSSVDKGISFTGSGVFKKEDIGRKTVRLYADGIASETGMASLKLETNSDSEINEGCSVEVTVLAPKYTIDLTQAKVGPNPIREGEKVTNIHSIIVPVKVEAPGLVNIEVSGAYDVKFAVEDVLLQFDKENDNIQYVSLVGVSGDLPITPQEIKLVNIKDSSIIGEYILPIENQPVNYSVICNSKAITGIYNPDFEMDTNNKVTLDVKVKFAGDYEIKTNTVNGVYFLATGKFENNQVGKTVTVTLLGQGKPLQTMSVAQYYISTNSSEADDKVCGFTIGFKYPDIQVLSLGGSSYAVSKNSNTAVGKMLLSLENFGPNGKIKVNSITTRSKNRHRDAEFKEALEKTDIVFIVYGGYVDSKKQNEDLVQFVKDGGVVIYGVESNLNKFKDFVSLLDPAMADYQATSDYSMVNPVLADGEPAIINGIFGSLKDKYLGNDYRNGQYFTNMRNITPLARHNDYTQRIWAGVHLEYGFVFVGDGGWTAGVPNGSASIFDPVNADYKGNPLPKKDYGGLITGDKDVYNSVFFMNIMDWAIKHVQINRKK